MKRIPEPELMDSVAQVNAYASADFSEPNRLFVDVLLEHQGNHLPPTGRLVDLGCGPGDICVLLARAMPGWHLTGLDAGPNMLARARQRVQAESLSEQVDFELARLPDDSLTPGSYDLVISNSLLHHLPNPGDLWQAVARLGKPGAVVQIMDLQRPPTKKRASELVDEHAGEEPDVLQQDFYNSLLAAWTPDEVQAQIAAAGIGGLAIREFTSRHWLVQGRLAS